MLKLRITTPNSIFWNRHSSGYLILQYMSMWNSPKATYLYDEYNILCFKILWDFLRHAILFMWQALTFIYMLEPVRIGLYGDAAELIHGFIGAWKKLISSENSFCRYKILS